MPARLPSVRHLDGGAGATRPGLVGEETARAGSRAPRGGMCRNATGRWDRVYDLFRRWQRDGTWAGILTALQAEADAKGLITWEVNVDSTVCRAHRHTAGAAKRGISKMSRPAASSSSRPTTASDGPEAACAEVFRCGPCGSPSSPRPPRQRGGDPPQSPPSRMATRRAASRPQVAVAASTPRIVDYPQRPAPACATVRKPATTSGERPPGTGRDSRRVPDPAPRRTVALLDDTARASNAGI